MQPISAAQLLNVWEWGVTQPPAQRALALLAAACPGTSRDALAQLSIGRRDAHLLTLREWAFGSHLASIALCSHCGERLDLAFDVSQIRMQDVTPSPFPDARAGTSAAEILSLQIDDYALTFRLPNSLDLATITEHGDAASSRHTLFERCVLSAQREGAAVSSAELPDEVVTALSARMAEADSQADVQLALTCPSCGHQWPAMFDITAFFWREIEAWAQRILREVHTLASVYGWSQADILKLSPTRRQIYLELIGSG